MSDVLVLATSCQQNDLLMIMLSVITSPEERWAKCRVSSSQLRVRDVI